MKRLETFFDPQHQNKVNGESGNLSSLEMLLLGLGQPRKVRGEEPLRKGAECPRCGQAQLDYNGILQLECPSCGFVSGDGGGCT
jgi:hypothetical protein